MFGYEINITQELFFGLPEVSTPEIGKTEDNMDKVPLNGFKEIPIMVIGMMENKAEEVTDLKLNLKTKEYFVGLHKSQETKRKEMFMMENG